MKKQGVSVRATLFFITMIPMLGGSQRAWSQVVHEREWSCSPVCMTHGDLVSLVRRVNVFVDQANAQRPPESIDYFAITISAGGESATLKSMEDLERSMPVAEVAQSVTFSCRRHGAPISEVTIYLTDSYRKISVNGESREQVDALHAMIKTDISKHTVVLAGSAFRDFLFMAGCLGTVGLAIWLSVRFDKHRWSKFVFPAAMILFVVVCVVVPFRNLFAGTKIFSESASWVTRNNAQLGLAGLVISILGPIVIPKIHKCRDRLREIINHKKEEKIIS